MKRIFCLVVLVCFVFSGCHFSGERLKEPVTFYYIRSDYQEDLTGVIVSEQREASGHRDDLSYLMALYLVGPVDESNRSPIPRGIRIYVAQNYPAGVILNLSETAKNMTDSEFSLAAACLSLTCLELTGTKQVTITCENRSVTMTPETILLFDASAAGIEKESK